MCTSEQANHTAVADALNPSDKRVVTCPSSRKRQTQQKHRTCAKHPHNATWWDFKVRGGAQKYLARSGSYDHVVRTEFGRGVCVSMRGTSLDEEPEFGRGVVGFQNSGGAQKYFARSGRCDHVVRSQNMSRDQQPSQRPEFG